MCWRMLIRSRWRLLSQQMVPVTLAASRPDIDACFAFHFIISHHHHDNNNADYIAIISRFRVTPACMMYINAKYAIYIDGRHSAIVNYKYNTYR